MKRTSLEKAAVERAFYLESILENMRNSNSVADARANVLVAVSGIILSLSLPQVQQAAGYDKLGYSLVALASFVTLLFTIGIIRPKIGASKTNTMYYGGVLMSSRIQYEKEILDTVGDVRRMVKEYTEEIYDFSLELGERFRMMRIAADILAIGLAAGLIVLVVF